MGEHDSFIRVVKTTDNTPDFFFSVYSEGEERFEIKVTILRMPGTHKLSWDYIGDVKEYNDERKCNKYALALRSKQDSLLNTLSTGSIIFCSTFTTGGGDFHP